MKGTAHFRLLLTFLALIALSHAPQLAHAEDGAAPDPGEGLQVLVGPGGTGLDPIAVPNLRCTEAPASLCRNITQLLRRNMNLSFIFEVQPPRSYLADPEAGPVNSPEFRDWINIGSRWLIQGEIRGETSFDLDLHFFNITEGQEVPLTFKQGRNLSKDGVKRAAYEFANAIIEARTGTPGVFGTKIAYSATVGSGVKSIAAVTMDGLEKEGIIHNGSINTFPAWGFGGVLYTSFVNGKPDLFFGRKPLTRDSGHYRKATVSPDGSQLVASVSYGDRSDLVLLSKDGTVIKKLTQGGADDISPTFSPDGSKIAFVSSRGGGPQIYVMGANGGGSTRLTHAGSYNYAPDWGKNGRIVFAAMDGRNSDIFTITESGEIRRLTQNQGSNKDPSWSPDGRYIAFVSNRREGAGLYIMSADGRYQMLIAPGGGFGNIAWQR